MFFLSYISVKGGKSEQHGSNLTSNTLTVFLAMCFTPLLQTSARVQKLFLTTKKTSLEIAVKEFLSKFCVAYVWIMQEPIQIKYRLFPQHRKSNYHFCFLDSRLWWLVIQAMEQDMCAMLITQTEMEDVLHVYIILIKTGMPRYATSFYNFLHVLANASLLQVFVRVLPNVCAQYCSYILLFVDVLCLVDRAVSEVLYR